MKATYVKAYKVWRELLQLDARMSATLLDLMAHPDAKDADLAQVRPKLIAHRVYMREAYAKMVEAHTKSRAASWFAPEMPQFMQRKTREVEDGGA